MKKDFNFYRLFDLSQFYSLIQNILVPEARLLLRRQFRYIFDKSRKMVLDVGCGPASLIQLPKGVIVGVDTNPLYVKKYIRTNKHRSEQIRIGCVCSADSLPFRNNIFNESRCLGTFHHLNRNSVLSTIREMVRCTRPGGKIVVFDSVWPKNPFFRPLAWLLCYFDRGKCMLYEEELLETVNIAYPEKWQGERFTYTFSGLEGLFLMAEKTDDTKK